jgi:hypothetical protein
MPDPIAEMSRILDDLAAEDLSLLTRSESLERILALLEIEWVARLAIAGLRAGMRGTRGAPSRVSHA